jgi:uncharacterized membrane protein
MAGAIGWARLSSPTFGAQGDVSLHYHLTRSFARSLAEGEWLPQWAGLLDGGRGDALFTFYPPLYYWLSGALVAVFGAGVLTALKWVSFLSLVLAQAGCYFLAREFFSRLRGALAAVAFVALPAYALIAINRGFLPQALAISLLPLEVLGAHRVLTGRRGQGLALLALSLSAIMLTHAITTYLSALTVGLMALCYLPAAGWRGLRRLAGGTLLALALTAFFWAPQLVEMSWVQVGLQVARQDYRHYFLFAEAVDASRYRQGWADLNYVASLVTLANTALALVLGVVCYRTALRSRLAPLMQFSLALALCGLLISLPISDLLWRYVPGMRFIQFPWRFQPVVALANAILIAASGDGWARLGRLARVALAAALTWLVAANLVLTVLVARPQARTFSREEVARLLGPHDAPPLSPEQAERLRDDNDLSFLAYSANQIYFRPRGAELTLYPPADEVGGLKVIAGRGRVVSQQLAISHREFRLESEEPVRLRIETYHYPNWVARLDGRPAQIEAEPGSGLMLIAAPGGGHTLRLDFEARHPAAGWARALSVAAWLSLLGWAIWRVRGRRST